MNVFGGSFRRDLFFETLVPPPSPRLYSTVALKEGGGFPLSVQGVDGTGGSSRPSALPDRRLGATGARTGDADPKGSTASSAGPGCGRGSK